MPYDPNDLSAPQAMLQMAAYRQSLPALYVDSVKVEVAGL